MKSKLCKVWKGYKSVINQSNNPLQTTIILYLFFFSFFLSSFQTQNKSEFNDLIWKKMFNDKKFYTNDENISNNFYDKNLI